MILTRNLHPVTELFPDGGDVHGDADDFLVCRELFGVDGSEEGPGVLVAAQLGQDGLADGDVLVNLCASRALLLRDLDLLCDGRVALHQTGVWCLLSTLLLFGGGEDLAGSLELLLGCLPITARTAPLAARGLINTLQSITEASGRY